MDKVKLGRALGYGARHAMKTLGQAVDAATSPDPYAERGVAANRPETRAHLSHTATAEAGVLQAIEGLRQVSAMKHAVKTQAVAQVKRSFWVPLKSFSSVLWLQVTGSFFALFALTMASAVARHRDYFASPVNTEDGRKIYFYLLAFGVFFYFAVSNFVRANRRQRK